jgi:DMSO/TMAO reductase YedYZ molybdopterin-dependent catalytic subunit
VTNKAKDAEENETNHTPAWLHTHVHEPNPAPPSDDPAFMLALPNQEETTVNVAYLAGLPQCEVRDCHIVSTGHGTSGPFAFGGVRLADFVTAHLPPNTSWHTVDVISADGFGNRIFAEELGNVEGQRPMLLATTVDGRPMTRAQGLVRLIVPSETDDALRQVKWIARIEIRA